MKLLIKLCCLGLIVTASPDMAMAQARTWVGEVRSNLPSSPDRTEATVHGKVMDVSKLKSTGKDSIRPIQAATHGHPRPKVTARHKTSAKPGTKSRIDHAPRKKALRSDVQQQPSNPGISADRAKSRWQEIEGTLRPTKLIELCEKFAVEFAGGEYAERVAAIELSARRAIEIQHIAGLSGDIFEDAVGDDAYRGSLRGAVRGDKDAAYEIALAYKNGTSGVAASERRMEQWLRFSAELGSGRASWELSQIYNRGGFVADAARFEQRALDLGYRPAPRLPTRAY